MEGDLPSIAARAAGIIGRTTRSLGPAAVKVDQRSFISYPHSSLVLDRKSTILHNGRDILRSMF